MNGAHDLGGAQGFGPVAPDPPGEGPFHADWQRRLVGMTIAMGACGAWNIDMGRRAREDRPWAEYLATPYYGLWIAGMEALLVETGLCTAEEVATGRAAGPGRPVPRVLRAEQVTPVLTAGFPATRPERAPARFGVGDRVRAKDMNPRGHTRLPRYARGRTGTVHLHHGAHVFPDTVAHGRGEEPQHLYTVRFEATDLWGPDTTASAVFVDCFEPYLEPAA